MGIFPTAYGNSRKKKEKKENKYIYFLLGALSAFFFSRGPGPLPLRALFEIGGGVLYV